MPESLRLEFSEKFSANSASVLLNRGGIAYVCFLRALLAICQQSWELSFWEMMDCFVLLAYASLAASRTLFNASLSELYLKFRRFILLAQTKKWFLWTMAAAKAAENCSHEWGLTWFFRWRIYTSFPSWTHLQNLPAAEALSLKISSHGTSLIWTQRQSQSAWEYS